MYTVRRCSECDFEEYNSAQSKLARQTTLWEHIKKEHPHMADRIMRNYQTMPDDLYQVRVARRALIRYSS